MTAGCADLVKLPAYMCAPAIYVSPQGEQQPIIYCQPHVAKTATPGD